MRMVPLAPERSTLASVSETHFEVSPYLSDKSLLS